MGREEPSKLQQPRPSSSKKQRSAIPETVLKRPKEKLKQVSLFMKTLAQEAENFTAGNIANCLQQWKNLTQDQEILQIVRGDIIEFEGSVPIKHSSHKCNLSPEETIQVRNELQNLLTKGIIKHTRFQEEEYVINFFKT